MNNFNDKFPQNIIRINEIISEVSHYLGYNAFYLTF